MIEAFFVLSLAVVCALMLTPPIFAVVAVVCVPLLKLCIWLGLPEGKKRHEELFSICFVGSFIIALIFILGQLFFQW